ncbi:hypothetical protein SLS61_005878 [Didymella pomorum]|jgi:hypothetical protein
MEDQHRACLNKDNDAGTMDHVQIQMWSRLAYQYMENTIEVGIWVEPGTSVNSLFAHAHQHAGDIKDPRWQDVSSTFTAVFDRSDVVNLPSNLDPEDGFDDFSREVAVIKYPSALWLRNEWGVGSFGDAFLQAEKNQPRNRT